MGVLLPLLPATAELINLGPDLLRPSEAFKVQGSLTGDKVSFTVTIAPEYYLYRHRTQARIVAGDATLLDLVLPEGKVRVDEFFGEVAIYRDTVAITAPLQRQGVGGDLLVELVTQGCADYGVCYPPHSVTIAFSGNGGPGEVQIPADGGAPLQVLSGPVDNTSGLQEILEGSSLWFIMLVFFNAGLLLAFTPCVLPMVPIVLAITTTGSRLGGGKAFSLGATYVAGMAVVYTALGILAARGGVILAGSLQTPAVLVPLSFLFACLGLMVLLGFNLRLLPSGLNNWLARQRGKPGTFPAALGAGAISAVVVSPCVAAPLIGALLFIAATGDELTGGLALFSLALGMGVLPLACAAGAGSLLPRTGPVNEAVRKIFGLMLLGLAVWVLGGLLPAAVKLIAYGSLGLVAAYLLFRVDFRSGRSGGARVASRSVAVLLAIGASVLFVGGITGGTNELAPLAHLGKESGSQVEFDTITTEAQYREVYASPHPLGTVEYYTADWCISCRELDAYTFADAKVVAALAKYRRIKVDLSANGPDSKRLLAMHNLFGPPAMVVRGPDGRQLLRVVGYFSRDQLLASLDQLQ